MSVSFEEVICKVRCIGRPTWLSGTLISTIAGVTSKKELAYVISIKE